MTHFIGTAGDDTITGTTKADFFDMSQGGDDTVFGMGGKDVFYYGAAFTADDHIDGGAKGHHHLIQGTVELNGDYSAGVVFGSETMVNIAKLLLDAGHSYNLTTNATTGGGTIFTVDASHLGAGDTLIFDASALGSGELDIISRADHAVLTGSTGGYNIFDMGQTLDRSDQIIGHAGAQNEVDLSGDYSRLVLDQALMSNVSVLRLGAGNYSLTTTDDLVAAGQTLAVVGINGSPNVTFDGSAETDGSFEFNSLTGKITGGAGNDSFQDVTGTMRSGAGNDFFASCGGIFHLEQSGNVTVSASQASNDIFYMGASLTSADKIDGGAGTDTVILDGDYSAGVTIAQGTLANIETLQLTAGHSYDITVDDLVVASKQTMTVDGSALGSDDSLTFDGSAEIKGRFVITGGLGDDTLTGGQNGNKMFGGPGQDVITGGNGDDQITGGGGHDILDGGSNGNDTFIYGALSDSTGIHFDTVMGFDVTRDSFDVMTHVTGIDATIAGGALDDANSGIFNNDLAAAVDAAHLHAGHAVLFTPDSGDLAGNVFLVIDQNGIAGYQTDADLVIEISGSGNIASLSVQNFM